MVRVLSCKIGSRRRSRRRVMSALKGKKEMEERMRERVGGEPVNKNISISISFANNSVCADWTSGTKLEWWLMTDTALWMISHRSPDSEGTGNSGSKCSSLQLWWLIFAFIFSLSFINEWRMNQTSGSCTGAPGCCPLKKYSLWNPKLPFHISVCVQIKQTRYNVLISELPWCWWVYSQWPLNRASLAVDDFFHLLGTFLFQTKECSTLAHGTTSKSSLKAASCSPRAFFYQAPSYQLQVYIGEGDRS